MIIGRIRGKGWHATLHSNGVWKSSDEALSKLLNNAYSVLKKNSPSHGSFGLVMLNKAARDLGGEVWGVVKKDERGAERRIH